MQSALYGNTDIARVGGYLASAACGKLGYVYPARVGLCKNYFIGQQGALNVACVSFNENFSSVKSAEAYLTRVGSNCYLKAAAALQINVACVRFNFKIS